MTISAIGILAGMVVFILILQGYRWSRVYSLDVTKKKIADTKEELISIFPKEKENIIAFFQTIMSLNYTNSSKYLSKTFKEILPFLARE